MKKFVIDPELALMVDAVLADLPEADREQVAQRVLWISDKPPADMEPFAGQFSRTDHRPHGDAIILNREALAQVNDQTRRMAIAAALNQSATSSRPLQAPPEQRGLDYAGDAPDANRWRRGDQRTLSDRPRSRHPGERYI